MDNLTPQLTEAQLKNNIDALQKAGKSNDIVQSYVNNYQRNTDGTFGLKSGTQSPVQTSAQPQQLAQQQPAQSGFSKFADAFTAPLKTISEYTAKPIVETLAKPFGETVASSYELAGKQAPAWAAKNRLASPQLLAAMGNKGAAAQEQQLGGKGAGFTDVLNALTLLPGEGLVAKGAEEAKLLSQAGKASKLAALKEGALTGGKWGAAYGAAGAADENKGLGGIAQGALTGGLAGAATGAGIGAAGLGLEAGAKKLTEMKQEDFNNALQKILQGKEKDVEAGRRALTNIDLKGVKTHQDLYNRLDESVKKFNDFRGNALETDKVSYPLQYLGTTAKSGGTEVHTNHVENALDQLLKQYQSTGDIQNEARILDLWHKADTQGLSLKDVEDLSVEHGQTLKGYNAQGELASGLKKQEAENTRQGLKQTVDDRFNHPVVKQTRAMMSDLIRTRDLVGKTNDEIYKMQNRLKNMGFGDKVGNLVNKVFDLVTLGQGKGIVKGAIKGILPGAEGSTTMNVMELEKNLPKYLKTIQKIGQKGQTEQEVVSALEHLIKNQPHISGLLEEPKTQLPASTVSGSRLLSQEEAGKRIGKIETEKNDTTLYHGTSKAFDKFDPTKMRNGNAGKGIYLTDNPVAAKYHSVISASNEANREALKRGEELPQKSTLGKVLRVEIDPKAKIKTFDKMPTPKQIQEAKNEGYHGINYPDILYKSAEDWPYDVMGEEKIVNPKTTVMFDSSKVKIKK